MIRFFPAVLIGIFTGQGGWKLFIAGVLQVALQIFCAAHLHLSTSATVVAAILLTTLHLSVFVLFVLGVLPLEPTPPNPITMEYAKLLPVLYLKGATYTVLIGGVFGSAAVIGIDCWISSVSFSGFLGMLVLSSLGAAGIHVFGIVLPTYLKLKEQIAESIKARASCCEGPNCDKKHDGPCWSYVTPQEEPPAFDSNKQ